MSDADDLMGFFSEIQEIESAVAADLEGPQPDPSLQAIAPAPTAPDRQVLVPATTVVIAKPQVAVTRGPEVVAAAAVHSVRASYPAMEDRPQELSRPASYTAMGSSGSSSYNTAVVGAAPPIKMSDKKYVRTGAGEVWIDETLNEWPDNDFRLFVGDLGNEVTTEMLAKEFQGKYSSFVKAKVSV